MATDNRFELAVGVGGGTGKDLVRSVCQAGDARYVRRMFGYGRADPLYQSGRLWRGTGTRAPDGDPGMPVIRPALLRCGDPGGGDPAGAGAQAGSGTSRSLVPRLTEPPPGLMVLP